MIHLVTFASQDMEKSRRLCVQSALEHGVDRYMDCGPVEPSSERGYGFWKWKPGIIAQSLEWMAESHNGDILIYSDAGVEFINNVSYIIDRMDQDIFLFGNNWEHAHWCKADILEEIIPWSTGNPDLPWRNTALTYGKQAQASVIFFRVSDYSRQFVKEWLDWCLFEGGRLIDDSPSRIRNHPEFQENRHDQAILTTMAYREGIKLHWWPAIYNDGQFTYEKLPVYAGDNYPPIFHHHRKRNHEWKQVA